MRRCQNRGAGHAERLEKREAATRITYQGGDGSSFEKAVVIAGAKSSMDGVPAERKWLKKKYGNYEKLKRRSSRKEASIMTWSRSGRKKARSWSSISIFPDSSIAKNRGGRSFATLDGVPSPLSARSFPCFSTFPLFPSRELLLQRRPSRCGTGHEGGKRRAGLGIRRCLREQPDS